MGTGATHEPDGARGAAGLARTHALALGVAAAVLVGAALRGWGLRAQVLTGDELHTLNGVLYRSLPEILREWTFHGADYCVPLTAAFRVLYQAGVPLTETALRAPILLCGIALCAVAPWWLRGRLGRWPAVWLAWLLALSPALVLYSRIVRSYMPMLLLVFLALAGFERWWRGGRSRWAGVYVGCGALAVYFHLGAAPIVCAPLLWALFDALHRAWRSAEYLRPPLLRLARIGVGLGVATLALLLPARESLRALVGLHGGGQLPLTETWLDVLRLQIGTHSAWVAAAGLLLAARGAVWLARRDGRLASYWLCCGIGHVVGLVLLAPNFMENVVVLNRYLLPLLPFGLALVAVGLGAPVARIDGVARRVLQPAVAGIALVALFATGPLAEERYLRHPFAHSNVSIGFVLHENRFPPASVPSFYTELARSDEAGAVLEFPWINVAYHVYDAYERIHARPVRVVDFLPRYSEGSFRLRNVVSPDPDAIAASGARWLVVHTDLRAEAASVRTADPKHHPRVAHLDSVWARARMEARGLEEQLAGRWGPPDRREPGLVVWDLEAVRGRRESTAAP